MTSKKNTNLLKRWLTGEANLHDERQLEAAARQDPFLAEAFDGYRNMPDAPHLEDLTALRQRLLQKRQLRNRWLFWLRRGAAAAVLLLGVVFAWNQFSKNESAASPDSFAENTPAPAAEMAPPPPSPETKTDAPPSTPAEKQTTTLAQNTPPARPEKAPKKPKPTAPKTKKEKPAAEKPAPVTPPPAKDQPDAFESETAPIVDMALAPPALPDSMAEMSVESVVREEAAADKDLALAPAREKRAAGTRKKALRAPASALKMPDETDFFRRYVEENLVYPESERARQTAGEVRIRFDLKKDGTPHRIRVEKSLSPACDAEAIRLLKDGPKWPGGPARNRVWTFRFSPEN
ncbi:MAG: TonB family protein [Bacteroidetes bacterium]|nr:MAG: TonB family protein [Bacteroidota bacterium]